MSTPSSLLNALESIKLPPRRPGPHALATRHITVRPYPLHTIIGKLIATQRLFDPPADILRPHRRQRPAAPDAKVARRGPRLAARDERVVADAVVVEAVLREDLPAAWVLRAPVADRLAAAGRGRVGARVALDVAEAAGFGAFVAVPAVFLVVGVLLAPLEGGGGGAACYVGGAREVVLSRDC
jgi:hypothetical protein